METRAPCALFKSLRTALLGALAAGALAACGGGGSSGSSAPFAAGSTSTISTGVMTKGSTIVNGVRFDDTAAGISLDDTPARAAALQNGMVVKLLGTVNGDGMTGTAQRIKALVEVRGKPSSVSPLASPQNLLLNNQTVLVDDQTIFSGLLNFNAITTTTLIEVHGLRDAIGRIHATRIEASPAQMADSTLDEIRGVVAGGLGTNPVTFTIGAQAINAGAAAVVPTGANFRNGTVVEVFCTQPCISGGVFQASRIKVEDAQDAAFQPAAGQRLEIEGLVSGFSAHPGAFSVGTTSVTTTSSTRFEGGIATDLANDIMVEAEGSWNGTTLIASTIEFKRSVIRLQGNVTAAAVAQFTMNMAGLAVNIQTSSLTSGAVPPVGPACVQVRGERAVPATPMVVTAREINTSCANSGRPLLQAPAEAKTATTVTLLGFAIDVSNPIDTPQWVDMNGQAITTLAGFLNAVTPQATNAAGVPTRGTLVKVIFDAVTNSARQAEIEN